MFNDTKMREQIESVESDRQSENRVCLDPYPYGQTDIEKTSPRHTVLIRFKRPIRQPLLTAHKTSKNQIFTLYSRSKWLDPCRSTCCVFLLLKIIVYSSRAMRKPTLSERASGVPPVRCDDRIAAAELNQEPPRSMRSEHCGPAASHAVPSAGASS